MRTDYLRSSFFFPITIICFFSFLFSFVSVKLSVSLGIIFSFWLIMRAKPDGLLGLFLLYLIRYYFYDVAGGTLPFESREILTLAGFPLEVETVACGFISLRVFIEQFFCPKDQRAKFPQIIFFFWLAAFLPVLIGFYLGYQTRNSNWTGGLRYLMITGSYFYGYILAKNWPKGKNQFLIPIFLPLVIIMLILMKLGIYWSHHGFLFLGLAGAFSIYFIRSRFSMNRILGLFLLFLTVVYALKGSLTSIGIVALAVFFSYLGAKKKVNKRIIKFITVVALLGIIFFTFGVSFLGYHPGFKPSFYYGSFDGNFVQKIEAKMLSDRMSIWHPALKQIVSGPYFIIPSGRILHLETFGFPAEWLVSVHNVILEALRVNGLFSGTIMLIVLFLALKDNFLVLRESSDRLLKSLAAGILSVGIMGMTLNCVPIEMTAGFWIWSLAGLCHGLFLFQQNRTLAPELE